jgi:hypothetical protein
MVLEEETSENKKGRKEILGFGCGSVVVLT